MGVTNVMEEAEAEKTAAHTADYATDNAKVAENTADSPQMTDGVFE